MKHARPDYDRIQDPSGKIGGDEPVFLLRAQDISAPEAVRAWAVYNIDNGGDIYLSNLAQAHALRMEEWQRDNPTLVKPADYIEEDTTDTPPEGA